MEFNLLATAQTDGFHAVRRSASKGGQYNGPCILGCNGAGNDRLRIQPTVGEYGRFVCEHCNSKGSGVDWLMLKRGMSKQQALQSVGWKPKDGSEPHFTVPSHILAGQSQATHDAPCQAWQTSARAFIQYAESCLWGDQGKDALDYLRKRGLEDATIKAARLGYNPAPLKRLGEKWGQKSPMTLGKGIVIPWFFEDHVWRVSIRNEQVTVGAGRYTQVAGGSNGLYLADFLHYGKPVVVVEGELDAISIAQECGRYVVVVATGSTSGGHTTRWIAALARQDRVFIAFDADGKGDKDSRKWLDRLENAQRVSPLWSDASQMLQDGVRLWEDWLQSTVEGVAVPPGEDQEDLCIVCGKSNSNDDDAEYGSYSTDGQYTCSAHVVRASAPHDQEAHLERLALLFGADLGDRSLPGEDSDAFIGRLRAADAAKVAPKKKRDYWKYIEKRNARQPHMPGSDPNKPWLPMMSVEEWNCIRERDLNWQPDPKLTAHLRKG